MMNGLQTTFVLCLSFSAGVIAQFYGPMMNRPHPIHGRRTQDFGNMLAMASLLGMEIPELLVWNSLSGGGFMNPVPVQQTRGLQGTLNLLNLIDGPDIPDPTGPGQGGKGGRGGKGSKGGGRRGAGQGEEAGGGRGRQRQRPRPNRRRNKQRAGK